MVEEAKQDASLGRDESAIYLRDFGSSNASSRRSIRGRSGEYWVSTFRACSFCTYSGLGKQTKVRIRVPFG